MLPEKKHLAWNTSGKFKLLGIHFNVYKEDQTLENFGAKIKKDKEYLTLMAYRDLNYIGQITLIETLALPILVHIIRVSPNLLFKL